MPGSDGSLVVDLLLKVGHLPVGLGGVDELGAHLLYDPGEALGETLVGDRVLLQPLVNLGADGVSITEAWVSAWGKWAIFSSKSWSRMETGCII